MVDESLTPGQLSVGLHTEKDSDFVETAARKPGGVSKVQSSAYPSLSDSDGDLDSSESEDEGTKLETPRSTKHMTPKQHSLFSKKCTPKSQAGSATTKNHAGHQSGRRPLGSLTLNSQPRKKARVADSESTSETSKTNFLLEKVLKRLQQTEQRMKRIEQQLEKENSGSSSSTSGTKTTPKSKSIPPEVRVSI